MVFPIGSKNMKTLLCLALVALYCAGCSSPMDVDTDRTSVDITPGEPGGSLLPATYIDVFLVNSFGSESYHALSAAFANPQDVTIDTTVFPAVLNMVVEVGSTTDPSKPVPYLNRLFLRANGIQTDSPIMLLKGDPDSENGAKFGLLIPKIPPPGYDKMEMSTVSNEVILQVESVKHEVGKRRIIVPLTIKFQIANIPDNTFSYSGKITVDY